MADNYDLAPFSDVTGYESSFLDNDWRKYSLEAFIDKFFDKSQTIRVDSDFDIFLGGPDITYPDHPRQNASNDGLHEVLEGYMFSYQDKNRNNKYDEGIDKMGGPSLSLKLFMSSDGAWLMETAKKLENRVGDNTLVIFLEMDDILYPDLISDSVMLCIGGKNAAAYFNDPKVAEWYGLSITISKATVQGLVQSCANKDAFQTMLKSTISGFGKILSWVPRMAGSLFMWVGEKLEALRIAENTWNKDRVTPLLEAMKEFRENVLTGLNEIIATKTFNFLGIPLRIPEGIINMLKGVAAICDIVLTAIEGFVKGVGKILEFVFALICGVINGLLDLIGGLFSFVGFILKAIAGGIEGVAEVASDPDYYMALLYEYTDNALQAIKKIDWGKVVDNIKSWLEKIIAAIDPKALASNLHVSARELAYYIGYIGINILACFIGVGEIAALMKLRKLEGPLMAIIEAVGDVVGKLPAGVKITVETLFGVFKSYLGLLAKGTKAVIELINKIFEKLLKWIVSLTRELFYLMIGGRRLALSVMPPALLLQLLADLATIFVRRNLDRLGIQILETEGLYMIRYGEHVLQVTDKNGMRRYINEKLDMEEAAAKKRLDEEVELLAQLDKRIAYMEKHWTDHTGDGRKYGRHELETLSDREVRYETEFRPSEKGEAGDAIAKSGKWEGKSFDAWGTPKDAFTRNSWQHKYQRSVNDLLTSIDDHFSKIANPKPGVSPLDKLIIDFKNFDEFNPELRKLVMKRIEDKHSTYLNTDFLDIIN